MVENWELNEIKYKRNLLEVSGYWFWVLKATKGSSGPFPRVGGLPIVISQTGSSFGYKTLTSNSSF